VDRPSHRMHDVGGFPSRECVGDIFGHDGSPIEEELCESHPLAASR
jgi:hypothetical protein